MDGVQAVAHEASKNPDTLVFLMAAFIIFQVVQVAMKAMEMRGDKKDKKDCTLTDEHKCKSVVSPQAVSDIFGGMAKIKEDTKWLKDAHDEKDPRTGQFRWYSDPELRTAIKENTAAAKDLTQVMSGLKQDVDLMLMKDQQR